MSTIGDQLTEEKKDENITLSSGSVFDKKEELPANAEGAPSLYQRISMKEKAFQDMDAGFDELTRTIADGIVSGNTVGKIQKPDTNIMEEAEQEKLNEKEIEEKEYLESIYPPEAIKIAEVFHEKIQDILLSNENAFFYSFDDESTGIPGLTVRFRSLTSGEDGGLLKKFRYLGWDDNQTSISDSLISLERIKLSLVSYCGKDLSRMVEEEKNKFIDSIPSLMARKIREKMEVFELALNIISCGEEHYKLIKKYLVRQ